MIRTDNLDAYYLGLKFGINYPKNVAIAFDGKNIKLFSNFIQGAIDAGSQIQNKYCSDLPTFLYTVTCNKITSVYLRNNYFYFYNQNGNYFRNKELQKIIQTQPQKADELCGFQIPLKLNTQEFMNYLSKFIQKSTFSRKHILYASSFPSLENLIQTINNKYSLSLYYVTSKTHHIKDLIYATLQQKANFGIFIDDCGNKLQIIDNLGRTIHPEHISIILLDDLIKKHDLTVMIQNDMSTCLEDFCKIKGINILRVPHPVSTAENFAVTSNYQFSLPTQTYFDGISTALKFISILNHYERPLSEIINDLPKIYITHQIKIKHDIFDNAKKYFKQENSCYVFEDDLGKACIIKQNELESIRLESSSYDDLFKLRHKIKDILSCSLCF